jgi:ribosomal protein S2
MRMMCFFQNHTSSHLSATPSESGLNRGLQVGRWNMKKNSFLFKQRT